MLDALITDSLRLMEPPAPMVMPAAIMRSWDHQEVTALQGKVDQIIESRERTVREWSAKNDELKATWNLLPKDAVASLAQLDDIGNAIAKLDAAAEDLIIANRRLKNQADRAAKNLGLSADRRALVISFAKRHHEIDARLLEVVLDLAWSMRSLRAQVAPDRGAGPTFDNPDDLERYLASA